MRRSDNIRLKLVAQNQKGLSLMEILIALSLMAVAGTFIVGKLLDQQYEGNKSAAIIQMNSFKDRLNEFKRHCFFYPNTEQGLEALISKPSGGRDCKKYNPGGYLNSEEVPLDPWGNPYLYESDGQKFNIISLGEDGLEGGEEKNADIYLNTPKTQQ